MCVLCGQFVTQVHWTDRGPDPERDAARQNFQQRYLQRSHLIGILNRVLKHYGLRVSDWTGVWYVLTDGKGGSALVQNLGELWRAAEGLARTKLDPLNPDFLAGLTGSERG